MRFSVDARRATPRHACWRARRAPSAGSAGRARRRGSGTTRRTARRHRRSSATGTAGRRTSRRRPSSQRELNATPSSTARTRSARVVAQRQVVPAAAQPVVVDRRAFAVQPRREDDAAAPGGRARGERVDARVDVVGHRRLAQRVVGIEHVVAEPVDARARPTPARRRRSTCPATATGSDAMSAEDVGLLERHVARDPRRRADVEVTFEVAHRARADRGRLDIGRAADDRDARPASPSSAATSRCSSPMTVVAGTRSGSWARSTRRRARAARRRSRRASRSRLSVTQCSTIESKVAAATPVSLKFSQSFGSRYFHVARAISGSCSCSQRMCAIGSLPDRDGAPPVSRIQRRSLRGS